MSDSKGATTTLYSGHRTLGLIATLENGAQFMYFLIITVLVVAIPFTYGLYLFSEGNTDVGIFLIACSTIVLLSALFGLAVKAGADAISAGFYLAKRP